MASTLASSPAASVRVGLCASRMCSNIAASLSALKLHSLKLQCARGKSYASSLSVSFWQCHGNVGFSARHSLNNMTFLSCTCLGSLLVLGSSQRNRNISSSSDDSSPPSPGNAFELQPSSNANVAGVFVRKRRAGGPPAVFESASVASGKRFVGTSLPILFSCWLSAAGELT